MIDRVHFENFKSLANVTLDLGRFTALVGANGCGKSSVLHGLHLLSQTGLKSPTDHDKGLGRFASIYGGPRAPQRLKYRGGAGEMALAMRSSDGDELRLTIRIMYADDGNPGQPQFDVVVGPVTPVRCTVPPSPSLFTKSWDEVYSVLNSTRLRKFAPVAYLHLDASEMVRTSLPEDESPREKIRRVASCRITRLKLGRCGWLANGSASIACSIEPATRIRLREEIRSAASDNNALLKLGEYGCHLSCT